MRINNIYFRNLIFKAEESINFMMIETKHSVWAQPDIRIGKRRI